MPENRYSIISTKQLARICGVSQGTVDRALHGREGIRAQTRERILAAARKYGYCPDLPDTRAYAGRSMLFGMVLFDLNNDYFAQLVMDFEAACRRIGYHAIVMFSHKDARSEIGCLNQLVHLGVDGIVLFPVGQGAEYGAYLQSLRTPIVTVGNCVQDIARVGADDAAAMRDMVAHVLRNGAKSLLYYAPVLARENQENRSAQEQRYAGFREAASCAGVPWQLATDECALRHALEGAIAPAVLCPSDHYAIRVRQWFGARGDVRVCGFDNSRILRKAELPIDSVEIDRTALVDGILSVLQRGAQGCTVSHRIAENS